MVGANLLLGATWSLKLARVCRTLQLGAVMAVLVLVALVAPLEAKPLRPNDAFDEKINAAWWSEAFIELERMTDSFRGGALEPDGSWKLERFYNYFEYTFDTRMRFDNIFDVETLDFAARLRKWEIAVPDSRTTPILRAMMFYINSTDPRVEAAQKSDAGWSLAKQLRTTARGILETQSASAQNDPHWYVVMVGLLCRAHASDEDLLLLSDEALQRFPTYQAIYDNVLACFQLRWGDNYRRVNSFINMIAGARTEPDSDRRYALMYLGAYEATYRERIFTHSGVEWKRMKSGLQAQQELFPVADTINWIAKLACLAGDRAHTRAQMKLIDDKPVRAVWVDMKIFEACSDWAG